MKTFILNLRIMKLIIPIIAIVVLFAACNSKKEDASAEARVAAYLDSVRMAADTAGLAEFRTWKAQSELANQQYLDEYNSPVAAAAPVRTTTTRSTAPVRRATKLKRYQNKQYHCSGSC
jgi:uncharacterized lipoprotein NlpE involved in copper resistance